MKMMTFNPANCRPVSQTNRPAMNIRKEDQAIELQFTVPGFRREDLNIRVEDNHLVITGTPPAEEVNGFVRREFRPWPLKKSSSWATGSPRMPYRPKWKTVSCM